jgi:hypothetical protein
MDVNLTFRFSSSTAEDFFNCSKRNQCWNSGYGAGKTYTACQKALALLCKFPGYRIAIGRYSSVELRRTTMQTFFKVCPPELYSEEYGGKRVDSLGYCDLFNKSRIYWMHFDQYDEGALRSLELNSAIIDQAEEIPESVYLTLDSRVGRWDNVEVPPDLLVANPNWPMNKFTGKPMAPAYHMILINPPDEGEFHWIWQRFHPESPEHKEKFVDTHAYFQSASSENKALPTENLNTMLTRDEEWVKRFVYGEFSKGAGAIHTISPMSILETDPESQSEYKIDSKFIDQMLKKGALSRTMDHGSTSPTCCTWWATYKGFYFCYREYYIPNQPISVHRQQISELSLDEYYVSNWADPAIFKKQLEKYGGFWTVADEYRDSRLEAPPLNWLPADNNEFATRNRINELLHVNPDLEHPITGKKGCPKLFFIKRSSSYPSGCLNIIRETSSQKKKLLDTINGRPIYSDERESSISDHAYDTLRYFCASHLQQRAEPKPKAKPNSFVAMQRRIKALKAAEYFDRYGLPAR